jgi:hypothetical protein
METIRNDFNQHTQDGRPTDEVDCGRGTKPVEGRHARNHLIPSIEGHCQLIRRLVVCGYYAEAYEIFSQFPVEDYVDFLANLDGASGSGFCVSQIYRLYLASILRPDLVPPEKVSPLRTELVRTQTESQTGYDSTGISTGTQSSFIHTLVVNALGRLGIESVSEYIDPISLLTVDIYVPSLKLGIEVQGPSHYITDLETGETNLRPEDQFKLDVLEKVGIKIEMISIHDFGRLNATRNSDQFVQNIIAKYRRNHDDSDSHR